MSDYSPLACPQCFGEHASEDGFAVRRCDDCGIEFRLRERVPIRSGNPPDFWAGRNMALAFLALVVLLTLILVGAW